MSDVNDEPEEMKIIISELIGNCKAKVSLCLTEQPSVKPNQNE